MQMSSRCKESPIHHHHQRQKPHRDRGRITSIVRELAATEVHLKRGITKGLITRPSHSHLSLWCMHHHVIVRSSRLRWSWAEVHFVWLSLCNFILRSLPPFLSLSLVHSFRIQCLLYKSLFRIFLCYITNQNQHNGTVLSASERTRNMSALRDCLEQEFILQSIDSNLTVISPFSLDVRTHWFV